VTSMRRSPLSQTEEVRRRRKCERCGALPGDPCLSRSGRVTHTAHEERQQAALTAGDLPLPGDAPGLSGSAADREARALAAEWIWQNVATDDESVFGLYGPDEAKVKAALGRLQARLEAAGPSLFHRLNPPEANREQRQLPDEGRVPGGPEAGRGAALPDRGR
jgi:hypothetical protein